MRVLEVLVSAVSFVGGALSCLLAVWWVTARRLDVPVPEATVSLLHDWGLVSEAFTALVSSGRAPVDGAVTVEVLVAYRGRLPNRGPTAWLPGSEECLQYTGALDDCGRWVRRTAEVRRSDPPRAGMRSVPRRLTLRSADDGRPGVWTKLSAIAAAWIQALDSRCGDG